MFIHIIYIYGIGTRKKTWRPDVGPPTRTPPVYVERRGHEYVPGSEYSVLSSLNIRFSSIVRLQISRVPSRMLLNTLLCWNDPCLRYESDMNSRTMQNVFHLEDAFFLGNMLKWVKVIPWKNHFTATTSIFLWVVGFRARKSTK